MKVSDMELNSHDKQALGNLFGHGARRQEFLNSGFGTLQTPAALCGAMLTSSHLQHSPRSRIEASPMS